MPGGDGGDGDPDTTRGGPRVRSGRRSLLRRGVGRAPICGGGRPNAPSDTPGVRSPEPQPVREATGGTRLRMSEDPAVSAAPALLMVQSGVSTAFTPAAIPATPSVPREEELVWPPWGRRRTCATLTS